MISIKKLFQIILKSKNSPYICENSNKMVSTDSINIALSNGYVVTQK